MPAVRFVICLTVCSTILLTLPSSAWAAPGGNGNGNGNAYGYGWYKKNGGAPGGAGGAPIPALGATLIGQALALGGFGVAWRIRQRRRKSAA